MIVFFKFIVVTIFIFISVAFLTLLERKLLSYIGIRVGPNKVLFLGILQPLSDALKLMNKQMNFMSSFSYFFYYLSSILMIINSILMWEFFNFNNQSIIIKNSFIMLILILSFLTLKLIISGWSTFSKYSLIGSIRSVCMIITYESIIYIIIIIFILMVSSFNFLELNKTNKFIFLLFPFIFMIWILSILAELNRSPFDFAESESELVSGFNTEFGSKNFTLIFLSEYMNILFMVSVSSIFFFSNENFIFFFSFIFMVTSIIWFRGMQPRYRYDKMMSLAWKFLIPFMTILMFIFILI